MKKLFVLLLVVSLNAHAFFRDEVAVVDPITKENINIVLDKIVSRTPRPTVILAHTCAGVIRTMDIQDWGNKLDRWGYNVVIPDSFAPRNYRNGICTNTKSVTEVQRAEDIIKVAEWIEKQPWHKGKIGLIGFSHGGKTVMEVVNRTGTDKIAAAVAYYPWCTARDKNPKIPTQIHIGSKDDWTPSVLCERVKDNYDLYVYEGAYHSFDRQAPDRIREGNNGNRHKLVYDPTATAVSEGRTREFFKQYLQ